MKLGELSHNFVLSSPWVIFKQDFFTLRPVKGAEVFKGEIFTFRNFLKMPPTGWAAKEILISRSSKMPLFAFLLCNFKNKKTVNTRNWEEQKQEFNQKTFQNRLIEVHSWRFYFEKEEIDFFSEFYESSFIINHNSINFLRRLSCDDDDDDDDDDELFLWYGWPMKDV